MWRKVLKIDFTKIPVFRQFFSIQRENYSFNVFLLFYCMPSSHFRDLIAKLHHIIQVQIDTYQIINTKDLVQLHVIITTIKFFKKWFMTNPCSQIYQVSFSLEAILALELSLTRNSGASFLPSHYKKFHKNCWTKFSIFTLQKSCFDF